MNHLTVKGTHYEIGQQLGNYFKGNTKFPLQLNKNQQQHGIRCLRLLERYFPEAAEEIQGVLSVISLPYELFGAWLMCMGSCLTFRENHNVEVRGCTAFCFAAGNRVIYGRDNDLPPYLKEVSKSINYQLNGKTAFQLNTSSFINGEEGLNEHGLVAAMTFVVPKKEEIAPGINSIFLVRYILENCKTTQDGIDALRTLPIASSCNILLADKSGHMVVVECNPHKIHMRTPELNAKEEKYIVTVNHFTSDEMKTHDASQQNIYSSRARYNTAYQTLQKGACTDPVSYAKDILSGKYGFMCQYKKVKFETIWSTIFDITESRMYLAEGNPELVKYGDLPLFQG